MTPSREDAYRQLRDLVADSKGAGTTEIDVHTLIVDHEQRRTRSPSPEVSNSRRRASAPRFPQTPHPWERRPRPGLQRRPATRIPASIGARLGSVRDAAAGRAIAIGLGALAIVVSLAAIIVVSAVLGSGGDTDLIVDDIESPVEHREDPPIQRGLRVLPDPG